MTRTPLRPLARILHARETGGNPDLIERENIRRRHEVMRDEWRVMAEQRLLLAAFCCLLVFGFVGVRMWAIASTPVAEPVAAVSDARIDATRADIVDRNGRVLATNLVTHSLYAQPHRMTDPEGSAEALAALFPDMDGDRLRGWRACQRVLGARPMSQRPVRFPAQNSVQAARSQKETGVKSRLSLG